MVSLQMKKWLEKKHFWKLRNLTNITTTNSNVYPTKSLFPWKHFLLKGIQQSRLAIEMMIFKET